MKKSELYHLAQVAVVQSPQISPEKKVAVMKLLIDQEKFELFCENRTEENENGKSV